MNYDSEQSIPAERFLALSGSWQLCLIVSGIAAVLIWLGGFLAVMTYRIISHLRFRKGLLEESTQIREGHAYDLYLRLLKEHRCQNGR